MIIHLIMAFLFGITIGLIDIGVELNIPEMTFAIFGFSTVCYCYYKSFNNYKPKLKQKLKGASNEKQ